MALSALFAVTIVLVALRFATVLQRIVSSTQAEKRLYASELDQARSAAFSDAMAALEAVQERIVASQTSLLERTVDMVHGPAQATSEPFKVDDPSLDARARWVPDDEWDYSALGIDPTDETMPDPRLEPEGNAHRAVMTPPGVGLIP